MATAICPTSATPIVSRFRSGSQPLQALRPPPTRPRAKLCKAPQALFGGARATKQKNYICKDCGYIYDGGEAFESLERYRCPVCSAPKRRFKEYDGPVQRKANQTNTRKARKAEVQEDTDLTPYYLAGGAAVVALVALYFVLNNLL